MPEPAQPVATRTSNGFANLLASFTGKFRDDEWDNSALADDVSTITYEQALRSGNRNPFSQSDSSSVLDRESEPASLLKPIKPRNTCQKQSKSASITIRVTAEEQAQLHERATAAQISVSAYLRSCIFEAEALRSQVKEALAQMHSMTPVTNASSSTEKGPRESHWRFFKRWFNLDRAEN